jgi:hypothetical protein
MLEPQITADPSQQVCVGVDLMGHGSMRCRRAAERQGYSDEDYSEGDKLD